MLCWLVSAGLLTLVSDIAAAASSAVFANEGGTFTATPTATFTTPSRVACLAACTSRGGTCGGFTWHVADGTCHVYDVTTCDPPLQVDTTADAISYRPTTCPGSLTDRCECPAGFTRCAGRCLIRATPGAVYSDAQAACAALNAHLFSPRTDAENQCAYVLRAGMWSWLGFDDLAVEGVYEGADGCGAYPGDGPRWRAGDPDNWMDTEHCVGMINYDEWNDRPCSDTNYPLCMLNGCYKGGCP